MGSGSSCLTDRPSDFGAPPKTSDAFSRCPSRMPEQLRLTVRPIGRKDPISLFRRLHRGRWPFFLDSSLPDPELARYSFLGLLPWATAGTPTYPFLGGAVGYIGYDLVRMIERLPDEKAADLRIPDIH